MTSFLFDFLTQRPQRRHRDQRKRILDLIDLHFHKCDTYFLKYALCVFFVVSVLKKSKKQYVFNFLTRQLRFRFLLEIRNRNLYRVVKTVG
jgi:hypothetical protein